MKKENLEVQVQEQNNPLWKEILRFSRRKYGMALILVLIGVLGFVIPVIPGILLILFALALVKPGLMVKIRSRFNSFFNPADKNKKSP